MEERGSSMGLNPETSLQFNLRRLDKKVDSLHLTSQQQEELDELLASVDGLARQVIELKNVAIKHLGEEKGKLQKEVETLKGGEAKD